MTAGLLTAASQASCQVKLDRLSDDTAEEYSAHSTDEEAAIVEFQVTKLNTSALANARPITHTVFDQIESYTQETPNQSRTFTHKHEESPQYSQYNDDFYDNVNRIELGMHTESNTRIPIIDLSHLVDSESESGESDAPVVLPDISVKQCSVLLQRLDIQSLPNDIKLRDVSLTQLENTLEDSISEDELCYSTWELECHPALELCSHVISPIHHMVIAEICASECNIASVLAMPTYQLLAIPSADRLPITADNESSLATEETFKSETAGSNHSVSMGDSDLKGNILCNLSTNASSRLTGTLMKSMKNKLRTAFATVRDKSSAAAAAASSKVRPISFNHTRLLTVTCTLPRGRS